MLFAQDAAAPERRRHAEHESRSNGHGVSVRDGARVLKTYEAPASRRYGRSAR